MEKNSRHDKIYRLYLLYGYGDSFGALIGVESLHHSDQFTIYNFERSGLLSLYTVIVDDIRGGWWTRNRPLIAFEGRI